MASSWTESVWDAHERALVDAYLNWQADLHRCGRQLSESLRRRGRPDPRFAVGSQICLGCDELERTNARREKREYDPNFARVDTVYTLDEMRAVEALEPPEGGET